MRRPAELILALLAAAGASAPACAEVAAYRVSVTPFIGYRVGGQFSNSDTGDEVDLGNAGSFGLIINAPADYTTEWELFYSRQSAGIDTSTVPIDPDLNIDISYFQAGGTYVFEGAPIRPFISAGIGASQFSPDQSQYNSETYFAFSIGAGAHIFPESRVGLRLEGRLFGSVIDSNSNIFCRSNESGASCAIVADGDILWQWEVFAGVTARF